MFGDHLAGHFIGQVSLGGPVTCSLAAGSERTAFLKLESVTIITTLCLQVSWSGRINNESNNFGHYISDVLFGHFLDISDKMRTKILKTFSNYFKFIL